MTELAIVAGIQRLLREAFDVVAPAPQTDLIEAGLLDSLALISLLLDVEREFELEIPFEALAIEDLRTVESIARLVDSTEFCP